MPEKDYLHAIYIVGIILFFAPIVTALLLLIFMRHSPTFAAWNESEFYLSAVFQTSAALMILYVAYKRFQEGYREGQARTM